MERWAPGAAAELLPVVFKFALVAAPGAKAFGAPAGVALRTGLYLRAGR